MNRPIQLQLFRLRDIGWTEWDPIGLRHSEGWEADPSADEYDSYLVEVAGALIRGVSPAQVIDRLVWVESEHMGLGLTDTTRARAVRTVERIGEYIEELTRQDH